MPTHHGSHDFTPLHRPKHSEVRIQNPELVSNNLRIILFALVVSSKLETRKFFGNTTQVVGAQILTPVF